MKRIICCLMIGILLLGAVSGLTGCIKDEPEEEAVKPAIVENGVGKYVIVYPAIPSATEKQAVQILSDKIYQITEVRLNSVSEEFLTEKDGELFIYIGDTTFEAAATAKQDISKEYFDAYEADVVGDDIYFVGASAGALLNAVNYFVENLVDKNYDAATKTLYFEGCHFDGENVAPTGFSVENVCEYSIVYAADWLNMKVLANRLQDIIEAKTGVAVSVYSDKELPEGRYEILLGETNRDLSARCYKNGSRIMEYEFVVEQCKLQMVFGGAYTGEKCIEESSRAIFNNKENKFTFGSYYSKDLAPTTQALTSGADVRIMSANILAYRWGEANYSNVLPVVQRAEIFAGVLLNYAPDAVGAQEMDQPWKQAFPWYLERMATKDNVEYTYTHSSATADGTTMINFSAILYRSDMYDLDESGCEPFSIWTVTPNYFQRVASYVKLTGKTDKSKEFVLVNTHWAHEDHETVNACADEQAELVNRLKAKYQGVTVFCTGDYNNLSTREWGDTYLNKMVDAIDGSIASVAAKQKGVLITPGGCRGSAKNMRENLLREVDDNFIDHIISSGGACEVMRHDTIRANYCHVLTDHSPIYADIDLK